MLDISIQRLGPDDLGEMHALLSVFGDAFCEVATYNENRPTDAYLRDLLSDRTFIALVAREGDEVVGGLAAYVLRKFEQPRSEIYVYDVAVAEKHRRRGVAKALFRALDAIAADIGAYVAFVQADYGDEPAIALYSSLGDREEVLHFDIPVSRPG